MMKNNTEKRNMSGIVTALVLGFVLMLGGFCYSMSILNMRGVARAANGTGAVVVEASSGRVLYDGGKDVVLYPASTTKILTALVVLENLPLDHIVKIPKQAVGIEGSSIYLREGEELTVEELLYGLMLRSGNDSACALALAVSPSIEDFAVLMNEKARDCGAKNSNFVNPHGLHDDNHYTTAYDLALITAEAYKNPDFARIAATKKVTISGIEGKRYLANKNKLLGMIEGGNGVKTGYTKKSGRCLVGAAQRDGMQLVSVVLNHGDMWNDSIRMLENVFSEYYMCELPMSVAVSPEAKIIDVETEFDNAGNFEPFSYPIRRDGSEQINIVPKKA